MLDTGASRAWRGSFRVRSANVSRGASEVAEQAAAPAAKGPRPRAASSRVTFDRDLDALVREVCALGVLASAALESALEVLAADARLLIASMHIGLHLERIGDLAVNVAELTKLSAGLPRDPVVVRNLEVMGATALGVVDALNRAGLKRVLAVGTPRGRHRWGVYMDEVARQLERAGDHAVDIAEQVWFMVTGELREFTSPAQVRGE